MAAANASARPSVPESSTTSRYPQALQWLGNQVFVRVALRNVGADQRLYQRADWTDSGFRIRPPTIRVVWLTKSKRGANRIGSSSRSWPTLTPKVFTTKGGGKVSHASPIHGPTRRTIFLPDRWSRSERDDGDAGIDGRQLPATAGIRWALRSRRLPTDKYLCTVALIPIAWSKGSRSQNAIIGNVGQRNGQ